MTSSLPERISTSYRRQLCKEFFLPASKINNGTDYARFVHGASKIFIQFTTQFYIEASRRWKHILFPRKPLMALRINIPSSHEQLCFQEKQQLWSTRVA